MPRRCGQCKQPLSRDNATGICGACTVAARKQPLPLVRLEPGFWSRPDIRRALTDYDWRTLLTEVQKASGASQARIADAVGVSQAHISRIMNGQRPDPAFTTIMGLLKGLGAPFLLTSPIDCQGPSDVLGKAVSDEGPHKVPTGGARASRSLANVPEASSSVVRSTASPSTVEHVPAPGQGDDDEVKRRAALQLITALTAGATIPPGALETVFSGIEDALGNPLDIHEWERTVHEYGQQLMTQPAGALVNGLTADVIAVGNLLQRQHGMAEAANLLRVSAGLSACLAIDLGDSGDKRAARISWNVAKRAADASGDRDLRVWVRGRGAQDAAFTGRPEGVVTELAAEAISIADGTPSAGLARAHSARIYLAVDQGDGATALESLEALKRTFAQLPAGSGAQSVLNYQESQLRLSEAYAQVATGDRRADATLAQAFRLYPSTAHGPRDNLALMQAVAQVRSREIEAGLEHAVTVLSSSGSATAARTFLAKQLLRTLPDQARALPAAREVRELIASR